MRPIRTGFSTRWTTPRRPSCIGSGPGADNPGNTGAPHLHFQLMNWDFVEPMTGIEPALSAWEADVLPLNYIGIARP